MTVQCFMKRHVSLCLGALASLALTACIPNARSSRNAEEPEEPTQGSEWSSSSYADPGPSDLQRLACYGELAVEAIRRSGDVQRALNAWFEAARPLLAQFEFTPWDEIPAHARPLVQKEWAKTYREAIAERAIELQVPVSSMVCLPEHPDCDKFNPADSGHYYSMVIGTHVLKIFNASEELPRGIEHIRIAGGSGLNSAIISAVSKQHQNFLAIHRAVTAFYRLLPRDAVLPRIEWPEQKPDPIECRGVLPPVAQK